MFHFGLAALLRGFRTSDAQRIAMGALVLLGVLYRRGRRRGALIGAYELRQGEEMTVRVPKRWREDPSVVAAARAATTAVTDPTIR